MNKILLLGLCIIILFILNNINKKKIKGGSKEKIYIQDLYQLLHNKYVYNDSPKKPPSGDDIRQILLEMQAANIMKDNLDLDAFFNGAKHIYNNQQILDNIDKENYIEQQIYDMKNYISIKNLDRDIIMDRLRNDFITYTPQEDTSYIDNLLNNNKEFTILYELIISNLQKIEVNNLQFIIDQIIEKILDYNIQIYNSVKQPYTPSIKDTLKELNKYYNEVSKIRKKTYAKLDSINNNIRSLEEEKNNIFMVSEKKPELPLVSSQKTEKETMSDKSQTNSDKLQINSDKSQTNSEHMTKTEVESFVRKVISDTLKNKSEKPSTQYTPSTQSTTATTKMTDFSGEQGEQGEQAGGYNWNTINYAFI